MLQLLSGNPRTVDALGFLLAFALTALMDSVFHDKLPHDHGRAFAVNGELSKGKARGSGLIFVLCIALVTLAVVPFKAEYVIYTVLLIASMLSGYFDDAAETAWNEYKKGLIDLVIAVVAGVTYLNFNGTEVNFLSWSFSLPYAVYLILIIVLIWASINVVNCTDGVDGLSASLAVVSIGTFLLAYWEELGDYATAGIVFIGALLAYLWQNAKPSTLLMGDAGSRAMGFFLAVLALKSSHPFAFLLAALVFIVDGSLGILKISFKRFLHISILKNTLTPLHDLREVRGSYLELTDRRTYEGTATDDYLHITLTDEQDVPDALAKLRLIYPNLMRLDYDNRRTRKDQQITAPERVENITPLQHLAAFYELQNNQPLTDEQAAFCQQLIEDIWKEGEDA